MSEKKICCICGKVYTGFGNNAYPIDNEGRCCDECNSLYVIPKRISLIYKGKADNKNESKDCI